jgi:Domain of unknown function (DUF4373)
MKKKLTLDFFILERNFAETRGIKILRRKHKNDGLAAYIILLSLLCGEDGLSLDLNDSDTQELTVEACGLRDAPHLLAVIETCVEKGLFDRQLWEGDRILLSRDLYTRYHESLKNRQAATQRKQKSRARQLKEKIEYLENPSDLRYQISDHQISDHQISDHQISDASQSDKNGQTCDKAFVTRDKEESHTGQLITTPGQLITTHPTIQADQAFDRDLYPWRIPFATNQNLKEAFVVWLSNIYGDRRDAKNKRLAMARRMLDKADRPRSPADEDGRRRLAEDWQAFINNAKDAPSIEVALGQEDSEAALVKAATREALAGGRNEPSDI